MEDPSILALKWELRAKKSQLAHRLSAKKYIRMHLWIGIPAILCVALAGTTLFFQLSKLAPDKTDVFSLVAVFLSVVGTVLVSLQTFLRFDRLADQHQNYDAKWGAIKHQLELAIAENEVDPKFYSSVERTMTTTGENAPLISEGIWKRARLIVLSSVEARQST